MYVLRFRIGKGALGGALVLGQLQDHLTVGLSVDVLGVREHDVDRRLALEHHIGDDRLERGIAVEYDAAVALSGREGAALSILLVIVVMLALWQWLLAANQPAEKHGRILFHLALGSLCMAFVAGCRPQMVLFAALCLPIFWQRYLREKRLFTKQGITEAVAFVLPVVLVAIGLMWYNAARFGSPFDFGANYNLTSNDMTRRGFSVGRTAPAVLTFLFGIPGVQAVFPYLTATKMQTNYMGLTITELFYGGAFACLPLLWGLASLPLARRRLAAKRDLRTFVVVVLAAMLVLAVLDCQMAGMLYRYQSDWLGPLLLAAALAWALAEQVLQAHAAQSGIDVLQRAFCTILPLAVLAGACYSFCVYFTAEPGLIGQNPALYQSVSRLVQFWL